jgi:anti-sigma B factor antagonist
MINIDRQDRIDIITFNTDRIDGLTSDDLKNEIIRVLDNNHPRVILNLKGIQYIDSTGFGCFLAVFKTAKNNYGILKFACPEPRVSKAFLTLNLSTVFEIFDNLEDCIRSFII